jgi:RNA polymerase sigma factor (sigma-70 family)
MRRWSLVDDSVAGDSALRLAGLEAMNALDRSALAAQYDRILAAHGPALVRLTASFESLPQAREDLFQEILLAIWKALPNFRGDCSEKTFAFRVAHNRCLTHVWRRGKSPQSDDELPEVRDPRKNPEALAIDSRRRETLLGAIRALPVNYRQVITLALEDLTPAEIAAVLGVTENNVAVRLNRARKALRSILEDRP